MNKTYISFDVATNKIGYAKLELTPEGNKWEYETIELGAGNQTDNQIKKIKCLRNWFINKRVNQRTENIKVILETSTFRGNPTIERFVGIFMAMIVDHWTEDIQLIHPRTWQSKFEDFNGVKNVKGERIKRTKIASMKVASKIIGKDIDDDDQADAICMTYANARGWIRDNSILHKEHDEKVIKNNQIRSKIRTAKKQLKLWETKNSEIRIKQGKSSFEHVDYKLKKHQHVLERIEFFKTRIKSLKEQL